MRQMTAPTRARPVVTAPTVSWNCRNLRTASGTLRPHLSASTSDAKRSSSSITTSHASLASCVPLAPPRAKPTSATRSAAASPAPPPVIATTCGPAGIATPSRASAATRSASACSVEARRPRTNVCLSAGDAAASTRSCGHSRSKANWSKTAAPVAASTRWTRARKSAPSIARERSPGVRCRLRLAPEEEVGGGDAAAAPFGGAGGSAAAAAPLAMPSRSRSALCRMPARRATATAVSRPSPVSILTSTPAARHVATAAGTSGRTGSCTPSTPSSTRCVSHASAAPPSPSASCASPESASHSASSMCSAKSRYASPTVRIASAAKRLTCRDATPSRALASSGRTTPAPSTTSTHRLSTSSAAPAQKRRQPPCGVGTTHDASLRDDVKGRALPRAAVAAERPSVASRILR